MLISSISRSSSVASSLLDHPGDVAVLAVHDPAVAQRVLDLRGQQRGARILGPVCAHQRGQGLRPQERGVTGEHDDVFAFVVVIGEAGQADGQGVAGARAGELLDELDLHRRWRVLHERLGDPLAAVADDDHDPPDVDLRHGVEHVQDHRPATQQVQRFRAFGSHPRALTGGQDDGGEAAVFGHRRILSPPGRPACVWDTAGVPGLIPYDEFGLFHENAAEYGLPFDGPPDVRRVDVEVAPGRRVSSLQWGANTGHPELVLVHGGAQNAHTWDTVALALGRPLLAVDLPGHGHSDAGPEGAVSAGSNGARPGGRGARAGAHRPRGRRDVARRHVLPRAGGPRPGTGPRPRARRHHAGGHGREGGPGHQLRERSRQLRQLRRAPRPHH